MATLYKIRGNNKEKVFEGTVAKLPKEGESLLMYSSDYSKRKTTSTIKNVSKHFDEFETVSGSKYKIKY